MPLTMASFRSAVQDIASALLYLSEEVRRMTRVQQQLAQEQRITNLIVRSQVEADPIKREALMTEARRRMDTPLHERQATQDTSPRRAARRR